MPHGTPHTCMQGVCRKPDCACATRLGPVDPSHKPDKKYKQELVAYAMLFSLFERAFLMFYKQTKLFRNRQRSGWKFFLGDMIRRERVRAAWQITKETYDTDLQEFMDRKIAEHLAKPSPATADLRTLDSAA